jgi:hypothetical protein
MSTALERLWVSMFNAAPARRLLQTTGSRRLSRSRPYQSALTAGRYAASYLQTRRDPSAFAELESFCFFIGHNKSGTSLIGSLLDAHRHAVVADDVDALRLVAAGFDRRQLCYWLARAARRDYLKGRVTARRVAAYSYLVPGQWQGRYEAARVVGDSASGVTTRRLATDPGLLARLRRVAGAAAVRFVLVIRNPYDPIAYIMTRGRRSYEDAADHYFANCAAVVDLCHRLGDDVLAVRYESFVAAPRLQLAQVCRFLGLEAGDDYLDGCAAIVHPSPHRSRELIRWEPAWVTDVERRMAAFDFLEGYNFEQ